MNMDSSEEEIITTKVSQKLKFSLCYRSYCSNYIPGSQGSKFVKVNKNMLEDIS